MKNFLFSFLFVLVFSVCFAQVENPVSWTFSAKKINALSYEIHLTATVKGGGHIYSQTTPEGGPVPTSITFTKNPLLSFDGIVKESGKMEQHYEKLFGVDVKQFSDKVDFIQTVKLKTSAKTNIAGAVEFMTCNDRECLPPKSEKFSITLN